MNSPEQQQRDETWSILNSQVVGAEIINEPLVPAPSSLQCWCRKCRLKKREDEMFAGIIHPDGMGRGLCKECFEKERAVL